MVKTLLLSFSLLAISTAAHSQKDPLNIVVIGAHPDDCDIKAGGTAIQFAKLGHRVLFISTTNGDAGHYKTSGAPLAKIRKQEAEEAAKRMGITYRVLDNHDGLLMPDLNLRLQLIRLIREWNADVVIGPRPYDYHPDHRNTAIAIQDAAFLVIVPNIAPETPALKKNPVFLYAEDRFTKPTPFSPDIAVDISEVFDQKIYALAAHQSQFFEWLPWIADSNAKVPQDETERLKWLAEKRKGNITESIRNSLAKWYGEKAATIKNAEVFEICEYGRYPDDDEIRRLFPMLKK